MARVLVCLLASATALGAGLAAQAPPRTVVVFVDDLHVQFRDTPRVREFTRLMLRQRREGDLWGLVTTGTSSVGVAPTADGAELDAAIARIAGNGLKPADLLAAREGLVAVREVRHRSEVAFSTAAATIAAVAASVPAGSPLTVLVISNGYDLSAGPVPVSVVDEAARVGAVVHAIDPGLSADETARTYGVRPEAWSPVAETLSGSLRDLAERTGGIAVAASGDLSELWRRLGDRP